MEHSQKMKMEEADRAEVSKVLQESLKEVDFFCRKTRKDLLTMGLQENEVLKLLASHKSSRKYGYDLSPDSLSHILALAEQKGSPSPLGKLVESPFFLMKACWLYEHAPHFYFYGKGETKNLDTLITEFASQYEASLLKSDIAFDAWKKADNPRRILATTFWENKSFDPLLLIKKVREYNIEGFELNIDFHPFNYTKLLPEELNRDKRQQIREACFKSGIKIDIHSPIVGPYAPSPDPAKGKQRFFDPTQCLEVQFDNIELAKEIGAGVVVVHLIDTSNLKAMAALVERAAGSSLRVTVENYCHLKEPQTSEVFLACIDYLFHSLPRQVRQENFGITIDVGHFNIEGEDPLIAAGRIGAWCAENRVFFRVHATDNYGNLLFSPPAYSADVHGNVSGRGINNVLIIKLLRSLGCSFDVIAEQINPLTPEDIATIHRAQSCALDGIYESFVSQGEKRLAHADLESLMDPQAVPERSYHFVAGLEGIPALKEYLVYRKIQNKKHLTIDEAQRISQDFTKMPQRLKNNLMTYIDDLLLPIQSETGAIQKSELDLICQNISGAMFGTLNIEHLNQIFSQNRIYRKGDVICQQGRPGQQMYFVKEGEVMVYIDGSPVASLGPGEIFGEISLFYNVKRSATIRCATAGTEIGVLTRQGLENLLRSGQSYAYDVIYRLYNILPTRLRNMNEKYKTAIRSIHLIFDGDEKKMPNLEQIQMETEQKAAVAFPTFSQNEARRIFQQVKTFDSDELVFAEGENGIGAYFILEGRVRVVASSPDSQQIILGELGEGEMFGEMALIDEKPRSASVVALTPCRLAYVDKKAFSEFIETRSELAFRLMGFICFSFFRRILRLDRLYSDIKKKVKNS